MVSSTVLLQTICPGRVLDLLVAYLPREEEYAADTGTWTAAIHTMREERAKGAELLEGFSISIKPDCLPYSSEVDRWLTSLYLRRSPGGPIFHALGSHAWITLGTTFQSKLREWLEPKVPPEVIPVIQALAQKMAPLLVKQGVI